MKKSILTLALIIISVGFIAFGQTTNYGTSSGTLGTNNSFFGAFSGNAATGSSSDNAYVGFLADDLQHRVLEIPLLEVRLYIQNWDESGPFVERFVSSGHGDL